MKQPSATRASVCLLGVALAIPVAILVALTTIAPVTPSGTLYLLGLSSITVGALTAPWRRTRFKGVARVGLAMLAVVVSIRLASGERGGSVRLITLPGGHGTRWFNRLFHERDISLFGQELGYRSGFALSQREYAGLRPALAAAHASLEAAGGTTSSPAVSTYLFQQRPTAFDAVVVEPPRSAAPSSAVIFLHGFLGNFTVQCWLAAQAPRAVGVLTVCPSIGWIGDWWNEAGERTLRSTLDYLRARGVERVYLAGISNGAVGTCRLAPRWRGEFAGLIVISGADASAADVGLPVLALHGRDDQRMPAEAVRRYAQQAGERGTYREFAGDHLLMAKRNADLSEAFEVWLRALESRAVNAERSP